MKSLATCCVVLAIVLGSFDALQGQQTEPTSAELLAEIRALKSRFDEMESRHQQERDADRQHIRQLEQRLTELDTRTIDQVRADEIQKIRTMVDQQPRQPDFFGLDSGGGGGGRNLLNPDITVFFDMGGSISSRGRNKALNRFNLRETELDMQAAISPSADGVFVLTIGEEIESRPSGDIDIDRNVDIEEGYVNFHTLPYDLALKVGQFRSVFGRNNRLHTHDLPQVTRPLAVQSFFGPEGMHSIGASLSWLVPNPWDEYLEWTMEVTNADGGAESPILGGPNADNPAVVGHLKFFKDVGETASIELGASYLFAHTGSDTDFNANVFGLDAAYMWTDPDPSKFRGFTIQGEAFWAQNDIDRGPFGSTRNRSFGAYVFGQYQFDRDWYAGLRADYTDFPNSETRGNEDSDFALSPYLTWYISEFARLRLEYQHRLFEIDDDSADEDALFLQMTFVIGAHPPHPYWVHR